jgi:O-antigen/teichoic acid export membrane protein
MVLMGSLARNTYYNISAFGINTILSLATITMLVRGFGVEGYGIVILARMLLPNGIMGLLEAGFPEVTCRSVAAARATGDLKQIGQRVSAASLMAGGIGVVAALVLWVLADFVVDLVFHSADTGRADLIRLVVVSAFSLPLQLIGSVIRGAFEGSERFALVRSVEVLSNLGYLAVIAILLTSEATVVDAALAYVWIWNARSVLYVALVHFGRGGDVSFGTHQIWCGTAGFLRHAFQLFSGKFFSMLLNFGPSIALGVFANAGTVGSYEIVMRIPRVLKTLSGMFNGALLPFAARSDAIGDRVSAKRVVEQGTTVVVAFVVALSVPVIVLGPDVLLHWLGIVDSELSLYLRIALLWPVLAATIGIGSSMLLSRPSAAAAINKLSMATTLCYFAIAVGLYPWLAWRAFVVALIVSQALTMPAYWRLLALEYAIDVRVWVAFAIKSVLVVVVAFLTSIAAQSVAPVDGLVLLVAHGLFVGMMVACGVALFALPRDLRKLNEGFLKANFSRLR